MKLYFFRHAQAGTSRWGDPSDRSRVITPEGIQETQTAGRVLAGMKLNPAHIYSSPLTRAQQTAEIVAKALNMGIEIREEVAPGFNVAALEKIIAGLGDDQEVMFVGHEPDFGETISALIGGGIVEVKKGGFARVDVTSRHPLLGTLVWLVAPKVFAALG